MFHSSHQYHMVFSHCCFTHIWGIPVFLFGKGINSDLFGYEVLKNETIKVIAVTSRGAQCLISLFSIYPQAQISNCTEQE